MFTNPTIFSTDILKNSTIVSIFLEKKSITEIILSMQKTPPEIRILSEDVANRIAAGEVIDRPASAVKELVENAIDAGATRIEIEFSHGGKSFLKVRDNGCGMTREQALMSLEPHATSKIKSADDIFEIGSFGFRGEAIPSIASICKFTMRTRPVSADTGTQVEIYAGEIKDVRECGMPCGTEILVENIFCSVPARRKFLKSDNVEASHIIKLCRLYALSLPNIAITLIENSRVVFRSEGGLNILERIAKISGIGVDTARKLIEIPPCEAGEMKVSGAIIAPPESFTTSRNICAFINSRPVDSRTVYSALKEAYEGRLEKGRYAGAYIFLEIPPRDVDVNVHPAKREVRLRNEFAVREFLCAAISRALAKYGAESAYRDNSSNGFPDQQVPLSKPKPPETPARFLPVPSVFPPRRQFGHGSKDGQISAEFKSSKEFSSALGAIEKKISIKKPPEITCSAKSETQVGGWKFLAIARRKYALFETDKAVVIMSLSGAAKRIEFNEITASKEAPASQRILIPNTVKFERGDAEYFKLNIDSFEKCGFEIEEFGTNCYRISAIPDWLELSQAETFVRDFVELAREESTGLKKKALDSASFAKIAVQKISIPESYLTPHGAICVLKKLLNTHDNITAPDGSPIFREIPFSSIMK